jgi:predicted nucleic acid-binding protein
VSDPRIAQLEQQVAGLAARNQELESQLAAVHDQRAAASQARVKAVKTGGKWLIPLLDRAKVVRSFGDLAETVGKFTGPREQWPSRDDIVDGARLFMESCVRFTVRRRTSFWLFSVLAASIPFLQLWVVIKQNEIISNQNEFFEIQVHDVVSRSMTEGDRNARLMTGALLSRANLTFLADVVDEAFDPELTGIYTAKGTKASKRRLEDTAFRGFLIRAVARGVALRADGDRDELVETAQPMMRKIVADASDRVPMLLRFGEGSAELDPELVEQAANYLYQLGAVIRIYGRLARSEGLEKEFAEDLRLLLRRVASRELEGNRFAEAYRISMDSVVLDASVGLELGDDEVDWAETDRDVEAAREQGIEALSKALGSEGIDWDAFKRQL